MKKLFASVLYAGTSVFTGNAIAQQEIESIDLIHPDDIVTEEQYVQSRINYLAPPETTETDTDIDPLQLRYKSEIELAATLAGLDNAVGNCIAQREAMEDEIGSRFGSWSVNPAWVKKYQNCVLQRRADLSRFGGILEQRYAAVVGSGGEEGATLQTELIDRLRSRHAIVTQKVDQELRLQKNFVAYYNTGERNY